MTIIMKMVTTIIIIKQTHADCVDDDNAHKYDESAICGGRLTRIILNAADTHRTSTVQPAHMRPTAQVRHGEHYITAQHPVFNRDHAGTCMRRALQAYMQRGTQVTTPFGTCLCSLFMRMPPAAQLPGRMAALSGACADCSWGRRSARSHDTAGPAYRPPSSKWPPPALYSRSQRRFMSLIDFSTKALGSRTAVRRRRAT